MGHAVRLGGGLFTLVLALAACGGGSGGGAPPPPPIVEPGAQAGTLSVDLGTGAVSVPTQPANLVLSATGMWDGMNTLTIDLSILSNYPRLLFNLKALIAAVNQGTASGTDGTFGGDPFYYYGPEALAPGTSRLETLTLNGVDGTVDPVVVDLAFLNHPTLISSGGYQDIGFADSAGTNLGANIEPHGLNFAGFSGDGGAGEQGALSPDARFLYLGSRSNPGLTVWDLTTLNGVVGLDLSGGGIAFDGTGAVGAVDSVAMSPDAQFLYVLLMLGQHNHCFDTNWQVGSSGPTTPTGGVARGTPPQFELVKVHRATLTEVGRTVLAATGTSTDPLDRSRMRFIRMNAAGTLAAIGYQMEGLVLLVDLATLGVVNTYDVSAVSKDVRCVALSPDGSKIYVSYREDGRFAPTNDGTLSVIDVASGMIAPLVPPTVDASPDNNPMSLEFGPDGKLYYVRNTGGVAFPSLSVYDPATMLWAEHAESPVANGVAFGSFPAAGQLLPAPAAHVFLFNGQNDVVWLYDLATGMNVPAPDGDPRIDANDLHRGHTAIVTPW
ncbi:MAG: YncE family protein [Planctomycetota bacterium]|jgi:hypothetical protein